MIRTAIEQEIEAVLSDQGKLTAHLTNEITLADTGLDSMSLAILVTRLEDSLGLDPFSTLEPDPKAS